MAKKATGAGRGKKPAKKKAAGKKPSAKRAAKKPVAKKAGKAAQKNKRPAGQRAPAITLAPPQQRPRLPRIPRPGLRKAPKQPKPDAKPDEAAPNQSPPDPPENSGPGRAVARALLPPLRRPRSKRAGPQRRGGK